MSIEEKILLDKWLECNYHLDRMKKKWLEVEIEGVKRDVISREFKYEFNSFVNSSRSLTFVMQKCFKNKVKGFDDWYKDLQDELKKNEFAKVLVEIRNTNQKEGNRYPDIILVGTINKYFQIEFTYSPFPIKGNNLSDKLNLSEEQKKLFPENISNAKVNLILENFDIDLIYDNKPDETYEEVEENMNRILIQEIIKRTSEKMPEITEEEFKKINKAPSKLRINQKTYEWNEFYEECKNLVSYHRKKSLECIKLFT